MTKNDDESRAQIFNCVFQAGSHLRRKSLSGSSYGKNLSKLLIKNKLRRYSAIAARQDCRSRFLFVAESLDVGLCLSVCSELVGAKTNIPRFERLDGLSRILTGIRYYCTY